MSKDQRFAIKQRRIPTKPRSRSVPDVAVLSAQTFTVCLLSADVFQGASFGIVPWLKLVYRFGWFLIWLMFSENDRIIKYYPILL